MLTWSSKYSPLVGTSRTPNNIHKSGFPGTAFSHNGDEVTFLNIKADTSPGHELHDLPFYDLDQMIHGNDGFVHFNVLPGLPAFEGQMDFAGPVVLLAVELIVPVMISSPSLIFPIISVMLPSTDTCFYSHRNKFIPCFNHNNPLLYLLPAPLGQVPDQAFLDPIMPPEPRWPPIRCDPPCPPP